jgi:hypothetical protein
MRRFIWNRKYALILALVAACGLALVSTTPSSADPYIGEAQDDMPMGGGGGDAIGDPDNPERSGKSAKVVIGRINRGGMSTGARVAGDDAGVMSARMWHWYVVWSGLRSTWFRF